MSYVMSTGANAGEHVNDTKTSEEWVKETHVIYELKDGKGRVATILMVEGQFESCQYRVKTNIYDLDDWRFIGKIVKKIEELTAQPENDTITTKSEIKDNSKISI